MRLQRKQHSIAKNMRPERPAKRSVKKVVVNEAFASYNSKPDPIEPKKKKIKVKDLGGRLKNDDGDTGVIAKDMKDEDMEEQIAFCCYQCFCPDEIKSEIDVGNRFIQSSSEGLFHRRCCHDAIDVDENWMTPYECAIEKVLRKLQDPEEQEVLHDVITQKEIEKQYRIAMGHQSALYNADKLPGISNL